MTAKKHDASSPWQMAGRAWKDVLVRTFKEQSQDNISLVAAGVAFYGFLALVPMLGAIVLTYGIAADPQTVLSNVKSLTSVLPQDVSKLIGEQLMSVVQTSGGKKGLGLLLALAVALWGARNAASSLVTALNIAYEEKETRSFIRVNLIALAITAGAVVMAVLALLAITALGYLEDLLPQLPGFVLVGGKILSYAVLALGAAAGAATLYRYAPSREDAAWEWITPGSAFAAVTWLLLTFGFGFYVANFGSYNKTYGSLATVVILVTWMYLSAYVYLLGAELNSELEHQAAQDTTEDPVKPIGHRGAWAADHVAAEGEAEGVTKDSAPRTNSGASHSLPGCAQIDRPSIGRDYAAARLANRAGRITGLRTVGMVSSAMSTLGLSMLRKRGRGRAGAALVVTAVGLALLKREGSRD